MISFLHKKYKARAGNRPTKEVVPCQHTSATGTQNQIRESSEGLTPEASSNLSCQMCIEEKKRRRVYRWKIIIALFLPSVLANADAMIVAPAMPTIASHFGKLTSELNWIITAYTLTSTSFIPAYGQLADIFGRHTALQLSLAFMLLGSVLCAVTPTWEVLLLGRALQGLSAAGIINITKIVLADNVSLEENAKNNTVYALVAGISFSIGPVIGGFLTKASWRYCFVFSIPLTVLAQLVTFLLARNELKEGSYSIRGGNLLSGLSTIDVIGAILFIFGTGLIILGINWGGAPYAWNSAPVVAPLVIGAVLFAVFFAYECFSGPGRRIHKLLPRQIPMIPWHIFSRKDAILLSIIGFGTGAALYSAFYFISIYWNLAEGFDPGRAGVQLLYYTPGLGGGAYIAMFLCNRWPRQTYFAMASGSIIEAIGMGLLAWAVTTRDQSLVNGMLALSGVGTGLRFMPLNLHATGIWPTRIASIMSLMTFCVPFGGTLCMGWMGAVFTNKFTQSLRDIAASAASAGSNISLHDTHSLSEINNLPPEILNSVRDAAADGVMWAFISILPVMVLSALASLALGNVWIHQGSPDAGENTGAVLYGSYLKALFLGKIKSSKHPINLRTTIANTRQEKEMATVLPPETRL